MGRMYLNIIHRADRGKARLDALKFMQDEVHRFGFKTTILLSYQGLSDDGAVQYSKEQADEYGDELGIHLQELNCEEFFEKHNTKETAFFMLPMEKKKAILTDMMERFFNCFGCFPSAVGAYILDAATITFLKEAYPQVRVCITNCFEEGINMFHGNNHSWALFSDGGPWGAYYPSKACHLVPAKDENDDIGIVGLPHLNRDMLMSIISRDDLFSSHPANLLRAKIADGDRCRYMYDFIDQWIKQTDYNECVYYSLFVSTPWVMENGSQFESTDVCSRSLYSQCIAYLKKKEEEGLVTAMTMSEFACHYRTNIKHGGAEINLWQDILCGSKRQIFWYCDPYMRVALDPNIGGTITDLRPYVGRIPVNIGSDTKLLWNGNYPFSISIEHRGGMWNGPYHTLVAGCNGHTAAIYDKRTRCNVSFDEKGCPVVEFLPVTLKLGGTFATVESRALFPGKGEIIFERHVTDIIGECDSIILTETHRGTYGTTEYQENMKGIKLKLYNKQNELCHSIIYNYETRQIITDEPGAAAVEIPRMNVRTELIPMDGADSGEIEEGCLFAPNYFLRISKKVKKGGKLTVCLKMTAL